jgi:hypothetical protein
VARGLAMHYVYAGFMFALGIIAAMVVISILIGATQLGSRFWKPTFILLCIVAISTYVLLTIDKENAKTRATAERRSQLAKQLGCDDITHYKDNAALRQ